MLLKSPPSMIPQKNNHTTNNGQPGKNGIEKSSSTPIEQENIDVQEELWAAHYNKFNSERLDFALLDLLSTHEPLKGETEHTVNRDKLKKIMFLISSNKIHHNAKQKFDHFILDYLRGKPYHEYMLEYYILNDKLSTDELKYALKNSCAKADKKIINALLTNKNVAQLNSNVGVPGIDWAIQGALESSAHSNQVEILDFLFNHSQLNTEHVHFEKIFSQAALGGALECFEYLVKYCKNKYEKDLIIDKEIFLHVCCGDNLNLIKFVLNLPGSKPQELIESIDLKVVVNCLRKQSLPILKYLINSLESHQYQYQLNADKTLATMLEYGRADLEAQIQILRYFMVERRLKMPETSSMRLIKKQSHLYPLIEYVKIFTKEQNELQEIESNKLRLDYAIKAVDSVEVADNDRKVLKDKKRKI